MNLPIQFRHNHREQERLSGRHLHGADVESNRLKDVDGVWVSASRHDDLVPSFGLGAVTVLDALRAHARNQRESTAYTFLGADDEKRAITYGALDERARSIAHALLQRSDPGDRALLMYSPGLPFIEAFLGCLYAGVIAVPAYPPKRNRNMDRIRSIAEDCQPRLLLCGSDSRDRVEEQIAAATTGSSTLATDELDSTQRGELPAIKCDDIAFLQYTSGSTAAPKGVMVTHGNVVANEHAIMTNFQHTQNDVAVSWLPMFHDMGLIGGVLQPLYVGFPCYLMAPTTFIKDPFQWLKAISDYRGVFCGAPNFAYDLCVRRVTSEQKAQLDLSSWVAFNGSEPVRAETLERFAKAFASCGFRNESFFPCYGMAETTLLVSGGPPRKPTNVVTVDSSELEQNRIVENVHGQRVVSCGEVGPDLDVRIVDPNTHNVCHAKTVGEVWVHGDSVAAGYWRRPQETAETFRARINGDDRDWLRTGDYGFVRESELYITGRRKDLIIIRGRNLYPQDIENVIERCIGCVEPNSCAAFTVEEQGVDRLIVVAEGTREMVRRTKSSFEASESLEELNKAIHLVRQTISDEYEIALDEIVLVRPTSFPRTSSGKVQRGLTRKMFVDGELDLVYESNANPSTLRQNESDAIGEVECVVYQALREWASDEGHHLPLLDRTTMFASVGVDSMAAADIGLRLEKHLGVVVDGDTLYQHRSIGELCGYLAKALPHSRETSQTNGRHVLTKSDFIASLETGLQRFQDFERAGHDYFATEIERQNGGRVWIDGREMLMMASYSYLGLINRPEVNQAAQDAVDRYGTGAHGVRLLAGTFDQHRLLEREIADFFSADDAIVYSSGFMTNLATVSALVGSGDVVIGDELNHASIVDGCELSGATFLSFRHNDTQHLELLLSQHADKRVLVVVDAVYSMDGDIAPLPVISDLCKRYGALLMVDEAHSLGVIGDTGRGIQEHFGLPADAIDVKMGTLSKSVASCGGFIAARKEIIEFLKYNARGFIFSAALPAAQVGAAHQCFQLIRNETHLARHLRELRERFVSGLRDLGFQVPETESAIVPILFDSDEETMEAVGFCREKGIFVVPVFYPAVPRDKPRIRATVMASFSKEDIDQALSVFAELAKAERAV